MGAGTELSVFTFETTHMALWAEEVALEEGIPHEVIPTPPGLGAGLCDLALATLAERVTQMSASLEAAGVIYRAPEKRLEDEEARPDPLR